MSVSTTYVQNTNLKADKATNQALLHLELVTDINEIHNSLSLSFEEVQTLANIDRGEVGANMTTLGMVDVVRNSESYTFKDGKFTKVHELNPLDLEEKATHSPVQTPPYLEIEAHWDDVPKQDTDNVFGDTVRLYLKETTITIPKVKATNETLAYYGATIVPEDTPVKFPGGEFPIFLVNFGEKWLEKGVMTEKFGGIFLEYHTDQPYFHMAFEEGSYYFLAKWSDESKTKLQITAFELNPNEGVYTKKGVIHSDNAVKGDVLIGYSITKDFSVAFLRDNPINDAMVSVDLS